MSRRLLHKSKLGEFKAWLDRQGIEHRAGSGDFQVLQVRSQDGKHWNAVYERIDMPEHLTNVRYPDSLVARFCRERRAA